MCYSLLCTIYYSHYFNSLIFAEQRFPKKTHKEFLERRRDGGRKVRINKAKAERQLLSSVSRHKMMSMFQKLGLPWENKAFYDTGSCFIVKPKLHPWGLCCQSVQFLRRCFCIILLWFWIISCNRYISSELWYKDEKMWWIWRCCQRWYCYYRLLYLPLHLRKIHRSKYQSCHLYFDKNI